MNCITVIVVHSKKCEFQELYQSLWVEVLADLPRFNPDLGRATTFFRYSIKHAVCIFVSFKKYNTTPYLANQLEKIKKIQQECEESGTPFTVELASKYLHCTIPTVLNYQVKLGMESSFSYEVISVTNKYFFLRFLWWGSYRFKTNIFIFWCGIEKISKGFFWERNYVYSIL